MKYLIINPFFIGDILFSSSIARKLKEEGQATQVDFLISLPQPKLLLEQNKWIDSVYIGTIPVPVSMAYNKIIQLRPISQDRPATIQFQEQAGVRNPSVEFQVYTVPKMDELAKIRINKLKELYPNKKILAWQSNWKEKAYNTSPDMLFEIPKRGGPHRNIDYIISELEKDFCMIEMGLPSGVPQYDSKAMNAEEFALTASFIKECSLFIGSEGGLSNLSCSIGTKCIITTCFIGQVYGPQGFVKQIKNPQMGPAIYSSDIGHSHLPPFITDEDVINWIKYLVHNNSSYVYDWSSYDNNRGYVNVPIQNN